MTKKLFAALLLAFVLVSCGDKKDEQKPDKSQFEYDSTAIKTTTASDVNQPFLFRYNFEKGKTYKYRLTTISETSQDIKADTNIINKFTQTIVYLIDITPTEIDKDSVFELSVNFRHVKLDAKVNNENVNYLSGNLKDSTDELKFAEYESLVNNPFNIRLTNNGELLEVYKSDKISNKFLELRKMADSLNADDKIRFKNEITEGLLKPLMMQIFRKWPNGKVAKDSTWNQAQPPTQLLVFRMDYNSIYKINNIEMMKDERLAVIDGTMDSKVTGDTKLNDRGIKYEFNKPVAIAGGRIYYNLDKGLIQKSKTSTTLEMFYKMEIPAPNGVQKGSKKEVVKNTNIVEFLGS
ncbi:MAG: hypothetical protein HXY49_03485 [Ignavibacteriaceae bacterium]|nr:hypothetical protein [Ignavibacteriaceae bacterium]